MAPVGFEPTISAGEDRAATGTGLDCKVKVKILYDTRKITCEMYLY